ncbi:MAG: Hsp20/alpha crystallin family protein [Kiritimatiellia bacterium]
MNEEKFVVPTATFTEKPDAYELKVEVPGVGKEDAELHMDGKTLTLKTHAKHQHPAGFKQVAAEFERANYAISAELPEMADPKAMTAKLENGMLTVTIGKRAETQPKRIEIQ